MAYFIDETVPKTLPSIINRTAVSKTFQILYRHEEVSINDVVQFKVHTLVNANKVSLLFLYAR